MDDIDFDHSYSRQIENSNDTETVSHYYSEDQQKQIIDQIRFAVANYFNNNQKYLLALAKTKVGTGNRITVYEN